jgi:hypothetical protein
LAGYRGALLFSIGNTDRAISLLKECDSPEKDGTPL